MRNNLPGYFMLQLDDVCDIVLNMEPQLCVPCPINVVLLELFPEGLVPVDPPGVTIFTVILKTKVINLEKEGEGGRGEDFK